LFKSHVKESIENCKKVHVYMKSVFGSQSKGDDEKENTCVVTKWELILLK